MARRLDIQREVIQEVGDIDVELVADRDDPGKAHRALRSPVHHAGGDRARLRDQRQISRDRHMRRETRVEVRAGHHHAKAIGTAPAACHICARPCSVASAIDPAPWPSPAVMISAPAVPRLPASSTIPAHRLRWRRNHDEFGNERQLVEPRHCGKAVDLRMARIHQTELAQRICLADIAEDGPADRSLP